MADDLASQLAHAFTLAAARIADRSALAASADAIRADLAITLRDLLCLDDLWYVRGFRQGAAGEGGGHELIDIADASAYAEGYAAGRRIAQGEDVAPADAEDRYSEPGRCAVCGHFLENHQNGPNGDECVCGGSSYYREPTCQRPGCLNAEHHDLSGGDWRDGAVTRADLSDALAGAVDAIRREIRPEPDPIDGCHGYSAPDYTPDERHRHTIGGQTWEHAHEGGHEAHSAVSHDLSGAALIGTPEPSLTDDLRALADVLDSGYTPGDAAETVRRAAYRLDGAAPGAVSERPAFGWDTGPSLYGPRGIVARPESSASGNVILRVGNENKGAKGWTQSVHVVLTRSEARELAQAIETEMDDR